MTTQPTPTATHPAAETEPEPSPIWKPLPIAAHTTSVAAPEQSEVFAYGVVNLVIIAVGVGLTIGVNKLATRREAAKNSVSVG